MSKTINIGGIQVPEPKRQPLKIDAWYYYPNLISGTEDDEYLFGSTFWTDDMFDHIMMNHGMIHLTKEAAIAHAKALIALTKLSN